MKHKRYNLANWRRWKTGSVTISPVSGGVVGDFQAQDVELPLDVPFRGRTLRIFDRGFRWLHFAPTAANHALTVHLNEQGVPVQLYVDICDGHGLDDDGVPYVNDLYLDVIAVCEVLQDGSWRVTETEIIDQDDLDQARDQGKITPEQWVLAWAEARRVERGLLDHTFAPLNVVQHYLREQRA